MPLQGFFLCSYPIGHVSRDGRRNMKPKVVMGQTVDTNELKPDVSKKQTVRKYKKHTCI